MPSDLNGGRPAPAAYVAVISAGRPSNVARMETLCAGLGPTWYVPGAEAGEYSRAGARWVATSTGLCQARNLALEDADGRWCVQLSDDLRRLQLMTPLGARPVTLGQAIAVLVSLAQRHGAHLAGAAPTDNPYFAQRRLSLDKFVVGDLVAIDGASAPRFDVALRLKEDYDFTLQHLATYGRVLRYDHLLASFDHRTNRGGAVGYRTDDLERRAIVYLKSKWPGCIVDNPRRPNEVLLRWPAPA